jgi:DNA invertase Pin-like site-specific DNA recombinase
MKTVACYVRVSTIGQNEAGQHREIERWLKGNGADANTVRWYLDKSTGDNLNRPGFENLQRDIFQGDIGTVVIWRLDRLSRTMRDGLNTLCDWCDRSLRIVSVSQQIDFNGTIGKMIASVLFGVAEMEQQTRRERQRAGIDAAKSRGVYRGRQKGTTKATPDRALALRDSGLKVDEIATAMGVSRRTAMRYVSGRR